MADQKVSDLPSLNGVDVDPADLLYIVDSSAGTAGSKKITMGQFDVYTAAVSQTLTNKTISGANNTLSNISLASSVTGTLPVANGGTGATTLTGVVKGNGTSAFTAGNVNLTSEVTGTLPVASGGTGGTTFTANNVLLGNGTSAFQVVAPGTNGNVLTSNGTTWTSAAVTLPNPGFSNMAVFTSSGTWTVPSGVTKCKVTVTGGGGSGARSLFGSVQGLSGGGAAGSAIKIVSLSGGSATITIGAGGADQPTGGNSGSAGNDSTFVYSTTTITGGAGGAGSYSNQDGGAGGSGSGGDLNLTGGRGGASSSASFPAQAVAGGASIWGGGYGAGGTAYASSSGSTAGQGGVVVIEY